jgi:single-strand DNA-binding protein
VVADEIGPSLRWATAQVTKNERRGPSDGPRPSSNRQAAPPPPREDAGGYGFDEEPF